MKEKYKLLVLVTYTIKPLSAVYFFSFSRRERERACFPFFFFFFSFCFLYTKKKEKSPNLPPHPIFNDEEQITSWRVH